MLHLFNQLLAIGGVDAHSAFMEMFRHLYRVLAVEVLLLGSVLFQIGSGIYFIKARWRQRQGAFARLQAISGGIVIVPNSPGVYWRALSS